MKIFIPFAIFLTFVFNCQAISTYLDIAVEHTGASKIKGQLTGQMIGQYKTHDFSFGRSKYYSNRGTLKYNFNFPDYIHSVKLTWNTESSIPLKLKPMVVSTPSLSGDLEHHVYLGEKSQIFNGETVLFTPA